MSTPNGNGASRLGLYATIVVAVLSMCAVLGSIFSIAFQVRENRDNIIANSTAISVLQAEQHIQELKVAAQALALNEIETQFCSSDIVRNLMHAADMRISSLLWEKVFGTKIPTDNAYYPTICNRRNKE